MPQTFRVNTRRQCSYPDARRRNRLVFETLDARRLLAADLPVDTLPLSSDELIPPEAATAPIVQENNSVADDDEQAASQHGPHEQPVVNHFTNPVNRLDANNDGGVDSADANALLNALKRGHGGPLSDAATAGEEAALYADVNGDGFFSPNDLLQVINHLNADDSGQPQPDVDRLPFTNLDNPLDVDGSGVVTNEDATVILTDIASRGARKLAASQPSIIVPPYLDTNGDGFVSPADALQVLNLVNAEAREDGTMAAAARQAEALQQSLTLDRLEPLLDALAEDVITSDRWGAIKSGVGSSP